MKGKTVRGQLVSASPLDPNTTGYAIALINAWYNKMGLYVKALEGKVP